MYQMRVVQSIRQWLSQKKPLNTAISIFLTAIFIVTFFVLAMKVSDYIIEFEEKEIRSQNIHIVGRVIRYSRGNVLEVECTYQGYTFVVKERGPNTDIEIGEYFIIYYNENDPTNSLIQLDHPVFVDSSDVETVIGTVLNSETIGSLNRRGIEIEYPFRNRKLIKRRRIPYEWELIPGDTVFVQYKNSNPNICIIKLEE